MFQSRPLNDLIERSLAANPDIQAAVGGAAVAQYNARAQRATLFPTVQAGFGAVAEPDVGRPVGADPANGDYIYGLFTVGLTISYTLDLFGANRRAVESLEALAEAQCFQLEAAYLSLASNVVAAAIQEASLRAQIEATKRIIAAQRETLVILQRQEGLGAITGADVATQQAALAQAEATLPPLQKALAQQRNLLATLTGRLPSDRVAERFELTDLQAAAGTAAQPAVEAGRAAARRARGRRRTCIRPAPRSASPSPTSSRRSRLSAGINTHVARLRPAVRARPRPARTSAPACCRPSLDGGALAAKKRAAQAALEQADAQYRSTVLTAFRNVADTLRALEYDALTLQAAVAAERAAATSLAIARRRLELGDTTYVVVLIAELTYQQALLTRVQAQASRSPTPRRCSRRWAAAGGIATPTRCRPARVRAAARRHRLGTGAGDRVAAEVM